MFGLTPEQITHIAGIAGIVSAVIAAIGLPLALRAWRDHLIADLANPVVRERLAEALTAPNLVRLYERSLQTGLDRLESWMHGYGELARGYGWCVAVAMAYAAIFILVPFAVAGQGTGFGAFVLVAATDRPWWLRVLALLSLVVAMAFFFLAFRHTERIRAWQDGWVRHVPRRVRAPDTARAVWWSRRLAGFVLISGLLVGVPWLIGAELTPLYAAVTFGGVSVVAVAGVGAGPVVVAFAIAVSLAISLAAAVAVAGAGVGAFASALAGAFAGAIAGASAVVLTLVVTLAGAGTALGQGLSRLELGPAGLGLSFGLFFAVLPFANALLDWPSWLVRRFLGRDLLKSLEGGRLRQLWALVWHGAVDLFFAAVFLGLLAMLLPRAVQLFIDLAGALTTLPPIALRDYLCAAAKEPLGAGFWATSMLLSTLVPTALHLMFLIASPLAHWSRPRGEAWTQRADYLVFRRDEPPETDLPPDPTARAAVLAGPGINVETARKVAWWRIRQILLIYPAALALAGLVLWVLWELVELATGPLPAWLLWFDTFDTAAVEACLPGAFE